MCSLMRSTKLFLLRCHLHVTWGRILNVEKHRVLSPLNKSQGTSPPSSARYFCLVTLLILLGNNTRTQVDLHFCTFFCFFLRTSSFSPTFQKMKFLSSSLKGNPHMLIYAKAHLLFDCPSFGSSVQNIWVFMVSSAGLVSS